jgi:hypothetical protein
MRRAVLAAGRRGLAAVVLFLAGLAAVDAAVFKVWHPYYVNFSASGKGPATLPKNVDCSIFYCYATRPGWAIPVAIAIGLAGIFVAALIYRTRSARASALSGQPAILRDDERQAAAWGLAPPHA